MSTDAVSKSHFKTSDKQLMLRERWRKVLYLYICKHGGEPTLRFPHLPQQWQVVVNTGAAAAAASASGEAGMPALPCQHPEVPVSWNIDCNYTACP